MSGRHAPDWENTMHRLASRPALLATLAALALSLPDTAAAQSSGRLVQCRVESGGKVEVNGRCQFTPEQGGSFTLEHATRGRPLFGDILMVSVFIESEGVAEVRGLTRAGVNSRWGQARRSTTDRACWDGSDFKICAR
jgi:hypothetical protein